ncbi:hypothetical protein L6164_003431 [Bauhinia variegata]|uniref:Uncharacterized protein n=1 Tax=Bauhinia variegata TaxID=167791 RepID=A0ACB9Q1B8_BAUVA|nr:hypothetical protein L6164_003431 [Bauhinia variegata]
MAKKTLFYIGRMEQDDDLSLFRDLQKRNNDRNSSLLQLSEEIESDNGSKHSFYRIPSGKKESGVEHLVETCKNDYDWLKTPPATPLFPSLEMEPTGTGPHQLVMKKEIPIIQPLSRFAGGDSEALKPKSAIDDKLNPNNSSKPKLPRRSVTPSHNRQRPTSVTNIESKNRNDHKEIGSTHSSNSSENCKTKHVVAASYAKASIKKSSSDVESLTSNLIQKSLRSNIDSEKKLKSRGVSPLVRSTILTHMPEFSNVTPPNLRTDNRSISANRVRTGNPTSAVVPGIKNQETALRSRWRSCSQSVANSNQKPLEGIEKNMKIHKESNILTAASVKGNRAHIMGSKMVEKVLNARKSGNNINQVERETRPKSQDSINNESTYGIGRTPFKNSMHIPLRYTERKDKETRMIHR